MNFCAWMRAGIVAVAIAAIGVTPGCGAGPPAPKRVVELTGEIVLPPEAGTTGKIYVSLFQAWALQGELRHPLQLIENFETAPGAFSHSFEYPANDGEGLIVFAWADLDGDGVHCTMSSRRTRRGCLKSPRFQPTGSA